jgi:hypothetical protein
MTRRNPTRAGRPASSGSGLQKNMTIEQAIKKAVEGGYKPKYLKQFYRFSQDLMGWELRNEDRDYSLDGIFLDPSFWSSFGKAMGWKEDYHGVRRSPLINMPGRYAWDGSEWHYNMVSFMDNFALGKTMEEFFEDLS